MPTPLQNVRVPDPLWQAARGRAERSGSNVSDVIRRALAAYIADDVHEECGRPYHEHTSAFLDCPDVD
jgi:Ribbon-helix-helix protein, copG family